jgi:HPt (histidine-containing phosphotransfer) domain-containing protein
MLKGVAGNPGATSLRHSADRLESALHQAASDSVLATAMEHTDALLERLAALRATPGLLEEAASDSAAPLSDADEAAARSIARQIEHLLRQDDAQATELWDAHARALLTHYPQAAQIEAAIQAFDFEDAVALMEASGTAP